MSSQPALRIGRDSREGSLGWCAVPPRGLTMAVSFWADRGYQPRHAAPESFWRSLLFVDVPTPAGGWLLRGWRRL